MAEEKVYSVVSDAEKIIHALVAKYPKVFWAVVPKKIVVLGIENKERSKGNKTLAKIKPMHGVEKAIMQLKNIDVQYAIELYWSDWNLWSPKMRTLVMAHEILHISSEGKNLKHDCEDFRILLDVLGVDWAKRASNSVTAEKLPDLLNDTVEFNLDLLPEIEYDAGDDSDKEEKEDKGGKTKGEKTEAFDPMAE